MASLTFACEGLTPKPAATRISLVDHPSHCPSSSAFVLTSSEKMQISSKAAFNRALGFLETDDPLSSSSALVVLAPTRNWLVFLFLRLEWGFCVSVSDPECDSGGGEEGGREEWSPLGWADLSVAFLAAYTRAFEL